MNLKILKNLIFNNIAVQLLVCLVAGVLMESYLNLWSVSLCYSLSILIKDLLMFGIPFVVFSYLLTALISFEKQAPFLIIFIIICIVISNCLGLFTAYGISHLIFPLFKNLAAQSLVSNKEIVFPLWQSAIKPLFTPDKALIMAMTLGIALNFLPNSTIKSKFQELAFKLRDGVTTVLKKCFVPVLPIYVLGFVLKLQREGMLDILARQYTKIFIIGCFLVIFYTVFLYAVAAQFKRAKFLQFIREMIPAGLTGFSTMSSAATMPLTLNATEKNLNDRNYANFVVPTSVNFHLVGDNLVIPLTALGLLVMSGNPLPDLSNYLVFVGYYCLAKFSTAGIPGGGVLVVLPVAQAYLGLTPEMNSLLATIYILQDPLLTSINVMGNGAFAIITKKILSFLKGRLRVI